MIAYELLARLRHLTLWGQNEDGELEWVGTREKWAKVDEEELSAMSWMQNLRLKMRRKMMVSSIWR